MSSSQEALCIFCTPQNPPECAMPTFTGEHSADLPRVKYCSMALATAFSTSASNII